MRLLDQIDSPQDVRALDAAQLGQLADEVRSFLIRQVSRTGGHLGPNLGVVELSIALHRVFDSPRDPIIFDTGHQSYVHKILTGRRDDFGTLRQQGGLSGYPSRAESEHDWVENSHASVSLSWAEGMARGLQLRGETDRSVVAVVGDGALTGGMAWEAINNIVVDQDLPLIIIANDNGRSYTPTVGGMAHHLSALRTDRRYEKTLDVIKRSVTGAPFFGKQMYEWLHGLKIGLKDVLAPQGLFGDLGLKYVGPIDGHNIADLERALQQAKGFGGPVIVHVLTEKGHGYDPALAHEQDRFHSIGQIDEITGEPLKNAKRTWTDAFSEELLAIGRERGDVVAITAAMLHPTGLQRFAEAFPERTIDVGIAEQHATTSAAGLATAGLHPVVAIYSTFLNRAFDQLLMDVALHHCGVTFVLDRAGVTGSDGASHNGMWDLSLLQIVPGLRLAAPRDEVRLRRCLREAVAVNDAPTVLRYSKEPIVAEIPAIEQIGTLDVLARAEDAKVLVVAYGQFAGMGIEVAERLGQQGIGVTVVDPVWALPISDDLVDLARNHDLVLTLEDSGEVGGMGSHLSQYLRKHEVWTPLREFGIAQEFLAHASRAQVLEQVGLTPQEIARYAVEFVARTTDHAPGPSGPDPHSISR
ncbi:1-deoxy-D-xylulose-5-phosphate synthase [Granulicoccus phenolivorans]|uniref:1-deoxy-D-xylulose-5-phosphate synthase n=1 Tax=Granulicoccus phenolivorans TaxID=266854 RepID=UPI000685FF25|nr:1-deoxy-D-xylulose-5-phosphate synthase [Granulicoccus phenolivorans]